MNLRLAYLEIAKKFRNLIVNVNFWRVKENCFDVRLGLIFSHGHYLLKEFYDTHFLFNLIFSKYKSKEFIDVLFSTLLSINCETYLPNL